MMYLASWADLTYEGCMQVTQWHRLGAIADYEGCLLKGLPNTEPAYKESGWRVRTDWTAVDLLSDKEIKRRSEKIRFSLPLRTSKKPVKTGEPYSAVHCAAEM